MKRIIMIGIGETGCRIAENFYRQSRGCDPSPIVIAMDTDEKIIESVDVPYRFSLTSDDAFGNVVEKIGAEKLCSWLPCDCDDTVQYCSVLDMNCGTCQFRAQGLLAFVNMLNKEEDKARFDEIIDLAKNPESESDAELYVVASLAGGTGSSLFYAVALYAKRHIREKFGTDIEAKAFLVSPEVFSRSSIPEKNIHARANAYAAMREFEAINKTAFRLSGSYDIHFRIGQENEPGMGLLFDSENKIYRSEQYAPFGGVYIFDKIPGVSQYERHCDIWSGIIMLICRGAIPSRGKSDKIDGKIYNGISITEMRLAPQLIYDYIGAKFCEEMTNGDLLQLLLFSEKAHKCCDKTDNDNSKTKYYGLVYDFFINGLKGGNLPLVKAESVSEFEASVRDVSAIKEKYFSLFADDYNDGGNIESKVAETEELLKTKKPDRLSIVSALCEAVNMLVNYFADCVSLERKITEATAESGFCNSEKFRDFIFPYLKNGDYFVSPAEAFARICKLYETVDEYYIGKSADGDLIGFVSEEIDSEVNYHNDRDDLTKMRQLLSQNFGNGKSKKYYRGKNRELTFFAEDGFLASDTDLCEMENLAKYIMKIKTAIQKQSILFLYRNMIPHLKSFADLYGEKLLCVKYLSEWVSGEAEAALNAGNKFDGLTVNIGVSADKKKNEYTDYRVLCDGFCAEASSFSFGLAEKILSEEDITYGNIKKMLEALSSEILTKCKNEKTEDGCVLQVLCESEKLSSEDFGKIRDLFKIPSAPFRYDFSSEMTGAYAYREETVLYMSTRCADYLRLSGFFKYDDIAGSVDPIKEFEQRIFNSKIGIRVDENIPDDRIYISTNMYNLDVGSIAMFNEADGDGMFSDYRKAVENSEKWDTPLWNPHINCISHEDEQLPYLNLDKQKESKKKTVKAFLYGCIEGKLRAGNAPDEDNIGFFIREDEEFSPITLSEKQILRDEPDVLFSWFCRNDELASVWSEMFDERLFDKYGALLAKRIFAGVDYVGALQELTQGEIISSLCGRLCKNIDESISDDKQFGMIDVAYALHKAEHPAVMTSDEFADVCKELVDSLCREFCRGENKFMREPVRKSVYELFRVAVRKFVESKDAEAKKWAKKTISSRFAGEIY